jgi:hypothetical protein
MDAANPGMVNKSGFIVPLASPLHCVNALPAVIAAVSKRFSPLR